MSCSTNEEIRVSTHPRRRQFVIGAAASVGLLALRANAQQQYPNRPVRIIVPSAAGTSGDLIARVVAQGWSAEFKQPFIVQNVPGAGMNIGSEMAAKSRGDGYTIVQAMTPNFAINPALYKKLAFDVEKDFDPIGLAASAPNLIVASNGLPFSDLKGLIAYAKANKGKMNYASAAIGSTGQLAGALLNDAAGIDMLHIPAKDPLSLVVGNQVEVAIFTPTATMPMVRSGLLKAIAVTSAKRLSVASEVPTIAESGLSGFDATAWYGYAVPRETPPAIVAALSAALSRTLADEKYSKGLVSSGNEITYLNQQDFAAFMVNERKKWALAVRRSGAQPE